MRKTLLILLLLLATPATAQRFFLVRTYAIGSLPTCTASIEGRLYIVTDPTDAVDCSTGSGSDEPHVCICDGSSWVASAGAIQDDGTDVGIGTSPGTQLLTLLEPDSTATMIELLSNVNTQFKGYTYAGTAASKSATTADTALVFLTGSGYNGSSQQVGGHISIRSSQLWSGTAEGTYMPIFLTATDGTSPAEVARISGDGVLTVEPIATAPSTCSIGDIYIDTSGAACFCTATDTWSNAVGTGSCA